MTIQQTINHLKSGQSISNKVVRQIVGQLEELKRLNAHADEALEYLNLEDGAKDAFKELRRAFGLVSRFVCTKCGHVQSSVCFATGCTQCGGDMKSKVVKERPTHGGNVDNA